MTYLGIEQQQDSDKRKYLDKSQFKQLQDLQVYYQEKGTIEGFLSDENSTNRSGQLVKADENAMLQGSGSAMLQGSRSAIATHDESAALATENIYVEPEEPTTGMDLDLLGREAAELKARNLAMGDLVKLSLAQNMTFDDLDPDLQAKVTAAHQAANPKDSPASIASNLLNQYRSGKKNQNQSA